MILTIRKENFPTRCDICHQSDRFNPATGTCQRCLLVFENKSVSAPRAVKELPNGRWLRQGIRLSWVALVTILSICLVGWLGVSMLGSSFRPTRLMVQLGIICLVTALVALRLLYLPVLYAPIANSLKRDVGSSFLWIAVFLSSLGVSAQFAFYLRPIEPTKSGSGPVQTLRNVYSAEVSYSLGSGKGNYTADLECLGGTTATSVGFLDNTVTAAQTTPKSGYLLGPVHVTLAEGKTPGKFSMTAFPSVAKGEYQTGDDCYYLDETGIIRHSGRPDVIPDAHSQPIQ
ncbi:MAG: hypothetical protein K1Y36_01120 [Blastocatellia bacterium]|nr:hypothetical protein [Blastocatellia bacterium]